MWNLKYGTDETICETEADSHTERADLWFPTGRGGEGLEGEVGVSRCKQNG